MVTCLPLSNGSWTPGCLVRTLPGVGGSPFSFSGVVFGCHCAVWVHPARERKRDSVCVSEQEFDKECMLTSSSSRFILKALLTLIFFFHFLLSLSSFLLHFPLLCQKKRKRVRQSTQQRGKCFLFSLYWKLASSLWFFFSLLFFLWVFPLGGGEAAEAGSAFVEFSAWITALSLVFVSLTHTHTHMKHTCSPKASSTTIQWIYPAAGLRPDPLPLRRLASAVSGALGLNGGAPAFCPLQLFAC